MPTDFKRLFTDRTPCVSAALLLVVVWAAGCESRDIGSKSSNLEKTQIFADDFERQELGDDWIRGEGEDGSGEWSIKDGWVHGENIKNDPLWLDLELPPKVRIEFAARARSSTGDLKVEVFGDGTKHESGYILIFGGWDNQFDVIARLDEHGDDKKKRPSQGVEPNKTYEMAVERTGDSVKWFVDGEQFMTYQDPNPLRGKGHRYFAFNDWKAPVEFDNVRVYRLQ